MENKKGVVKKTKTQTIKIAEYIDDKGDKHRMWIRDSAVEAYLKDRYGYVDIRLCQCDKELLPKKLTS